MLFCGRVVQYFCKKRDMKTKDLLNALQMLDSDYGVFSSELDFRMIFNSLMRNLPKEVLKDIESDWGRWSKHVRLKASGFLKARNDIPEYLPVTVLVKRYKDLKGGKRSESRREITKRFDYLSVDEQHSVLDTFLNNGSLTDKVWAAKKARFRWRKEYMEPISNIWNAKELAVNLKIHLCKVVLEHFPSEFIIDNAEYIAEVVGYHEVCVKVGKETGFKVEWRRMSFPEQLYVKAKLGMEVNMMEMELQTYKYLYESAPFCVPAPYIRADADEALFYLIRGMDKITWAMGLLGMHEALIRLLYFLDIVKGEPACLSFSNMLRIMREKIVKYRLMDNICDFSKIEDEWQSSEK